jgi:hypothetical protein
MERIESVHEQDYRDIILHPRGWKTRNEMVENHEIMMHINDYFTCEL